MKSDDLVAETNIPIPSFRETSNIKEETETFSKCQLNPLHRTDNKTMPIPSIVNSMIEEIVDSVPNCPLLKAYFFSNYLNMKFPNISTEKSINQPVLKMINGVIVIPYSEHVLDQVPRTKRCTTVSESLESLIDGAIYSIIRRKNKSQNNVLFRMPNMLSMGYSQVSGNGYSPHSFCSNMPPGILCTKINSSVTYVKTAEWLKEIHLCYGDDFMRELILYCIILTPSYCRDQGSNDSNDLNYLQLSGPPLNSFLGKKWHLRTALQNKKAPDDLQHSSGEKQMYIPRHLMLYSQTFVKKVGLPCSHILNKRSILDEKQDHSLSLLHSMFNIYHINAKGKRCFRKNIWNRLRADGIDVCRMLLERHKKTDYARILVSICPLPKGFQRNNEDRNTGLNLNDTILTDENMSVCTQEDVVNYLEPMEEEVICNSKGDGINSIENSALDCASSAQSITLVSAPSFNNGRKDNPQELSELIHCYKTHHQVYRFLVIVLKSVFPYPQFWGSESNFTKFCQTLQIFLSLAKKETLKLKNILHGISITSFSWLSSSNKKNTPKKKKSFSSSDHMTMTQLVGKLFQWVYCDFVIPLLRSIFYITDTEFLDKDCIVYYRKPIWSKIHSLTMESLLRKKEGNSNLQYKEMPSKSSSFIWKHISDLRLGCSKLRLLPKKNGIRPIALLSKRLSVQLESNRGDNESNCIKRLKCRPALNSRTFKNDNLMPWLLRERALSTNVILRQVFDVLKYEYFLQPNRFGCGMLGPSDIYPRLRQFLQEFRQLPKNNNKLYFCSADIHKCYDNINQSYLYNLIKDIISSEDYLSQRYSIIYNNSQCTNNIQNKSIRKVGPPEDFRLLESVDEIFAKQYSRCIIIDQVNSLAVLKKCKVLELLKEHLFNHVVVTDGSFGHPRFLIQSSGIPQGSILSSFLCNYYYGNLENKLLKDISISSNACSDTSQNHVSILLRMMDDFLLITTDKDASTRFLKNVHSGIPHLGVRVNEAKTRSNYDLQLDSNDEIENLSKFEVKSQCIEMKKRNFFPWCGLLFDVKTCEVQIDYSRFETSMPNVKNTSKEKNARYNPIPVLTAAFKNGRDLLHRMKSYVRPRCQPLLYDSYINKKDVIERNFYEMLQYCAKKTSSYLSYSLEGGVQKNVKYIQHCVQEVIMYSYKLILYLLKKAEFNGINTPTTPSLSPSSIDSSDKKMMHLIFSKRYALIIGKKAFYSVFKQHSDFKEILQCK